jgi:hypothetical protein
MKKNRGQKSRDAVSLKKQSTVLSATVHYSILKYPNI